MGATLKTIQLDIPVEQLPLFTDALKHYHDHLHKAKDFKFKLPITNKERDRRIIKLHRLLDEFNGLFEQEIA
jgi:hypothetical protein